jgi:RimJ/RimL family protein N-acetyltransferase
MIGVFRFDRLDTQNHSVEVGLDITTDSRRQGFAREIYERMIPYFFDELLLNRLSLLTLKRNLPAITLYESLGFKREGILRQAIKRDLEFEDAYQYSLLASEFGN